MLHGEPCFYRDKPTGGARSSPSRYGWACPYGMHRFRQRSALAVPHTVMARLVRAVYASTYAATDGPDEPTPIDTGHPRP